MNSGKREAGSGKRDYGIRSGIKDEGETDWADLADQADLLPALETISRQTVSFFNPSVQVRRCDS
jgi:hypothetical protein